MRYKLSELKMYATSSAEQMFEFKGISNLEFDFPKSIKTVLFISCGLVRASVRDSSKKDYYEVVGRLYESDNPKETGENHIGKLYIWVYDHPYDIKYQTKYELINWHEDGSFDIVEPDGRVTHIESPSMSNTNK